MLLDFTGLYEYTMQVILLHVMIMPWASLNVCFTRAVLRLCSKSFVIDTSSDSRICMDESTQESWPGIDTAGQPRPAPEPF
jgi:hypothetical protein